MSSFDSPWTFIRDNGLHFLLGAAVGALVSVPLALWSNASIMVIVPVSVALVGVVGTIREIVQQSQANTPDFWKLDTGVDVAFWALGGLAVSLPVGILL